MQEHLWSKTLGWSALGLGGRGMPGVAGVCAEPDSAQHSVSGRLGFKSFPYPHFFTPGCNLRGYQRTGLWQESARQQCGSRAARPGVRTRAAATARSWSGSRPGPTQGTGWATPTGPSSPPALAPKQSQGLGTPSTLMHTPHHHDAAGGWEKRMVHAHGLHYCWACEQGDRCIAKSHTMAWKSVPVCSWGDSCSTESACAPLAGSRRELWLSTPPPRPAGTAPSFAPPGTCGVVQQGSFMMIDCLQLQNRAWEDL